MLKLIENHTKNKNHYIFFEYKFTETTNIDTLDKYITYD
jgi:hypothetical protein